MVTSNYEGFAFKLSGLITSAGSSIPLGTILEKVVLTTRDLLAGATPAEQTNDALGLTSGEGANFLINGVLIGNITPTFRAVQLITDAGSFAAIVFTIGADSYAIAGAGVNFNASTVITSASVVNTPSVPLINPISYGLLPEDANIYTAQAFSTQDSGGPVGGLPDFSELTTVTLFDTDLVRGNGELQRTAFVETLATVQFTDGSTLGGVETLQVGGYSGYVTAFNYLFDRAALAASGHSISDVAGVLNSFAFNHDLNWNEAGFIFSSGPIANGGGDNVPPPPPPPPPVNIINGTSRADVLIGTAGRDVIRGFDRNDTMTGGAGHDAFVFGTDSRSGQKSVDVIRDYHIGEDVIGLEGGASVRSIVDNGAAIVITLVGDGDRIVVNGAALNVADIKFVYDDFTFI